MFCESCGAERKVEDAHFCTSCGNPFDVTQNAVQYNFDSLQKESPPLPTTPTSQVSAVTSGSMKKIKKGFFLRYLGATMAIVGILSVATLTPIAVIGYFLITPGAILYCLGLLTSKYLCPRCGNRVQKTAKLCPICRNTIE